MIQLGELGRAEELGQELRVHRLEMGVFPVVRIDLLKRDVLTISLINSFQKFFEDVVLGQLVGLLPELFADELEGFPQAVFDELLFGFGEPFQFVNQGSEELLSHRFGQGEPREDLILKVPGF